MKTPEQILAEASRTIANMHIRPTIYVGSTSRPHAADTFDGMMWIAHWFWASIQSRERELRDARSAVSEAHNCSCQGFPDAYRRQHPNSDEESVFEHVRQCWAEIAAILEIDISRDASRP